MPRRLLVTQHWYPPFRYGLTVVSSRPPGATRVTCGLPDRVGDWLYMELPVRMIRVILIDQRHRVVLRLANAEDLDAVERILRVVRVDVGRRTGFLTPDEDEDLSHRSTSSSSRT